MTDHPKQPLIDDAVKIGRNLIERGIDIPESLMVVYRLLIEGGLGQDKIIDTFIRITGKGSSRRIYFRCRHRYEQEVKNRNNKENP